MNKDVLEKLIRETRLEDLPSSMIPVAELIGIDNLVKLCSYTCGSKQYFPMVPTIIRAARNRAIVAEYTGYNLVALASKYDLTTNQILVIVKKGS